MTGRGPDAGGPDAGGPDVGGPAPGEPGPADPAAVDPVESADVPADDAREEGARKERARKERAPEESPPVVAVRRHREPLAAALIGVLTLLLGFAFAVQVRSTDDDQALAGSREEDLIRILDDLTGREDRLRLQISEQRSALAQLNGTGGQSAEALDEARRRAETLGILNGTLAAEGPGLEMTIGDPAGRVTAAVVVKVLQELRAAGAETMQVDDVRVGASTAVTGTPGDLELDGRPVSAPYVFRVIGSPETMATAMNIPNGVARTVRLRDGTIEVVQSDHVVVDALRVLERPQYAEPTDGD
ncbi:Uncharacterized conserved protein YlxW, UPF0749 family [Modestobacter sp. DSM 44400]|uniref:DUF881 domain-containing protein n=1 Tax=Modestobacter sp. DSM 44400 TaxID=1550230 RepID=UPI00089B2737|nr:DUF881 domain-containing protein [Modestobacter sp. DSM 44400]SDY20305.1 Uncharacterized conserved protein YlxW, UPF0749 family [Modestobacter sp. DSM 44400]